MRLPGTMILAVGNPGRKLAVCVEHAVDPEPDHYFFGEVGIGSGGDVNWIRLVDGHAKLLCEAVLREIERRKVERGP